MYTDIVLVKFDLHHVLSDGTKQKFKADLAKRKKKQQGKVQAKKREDRDRKKEEMERINRLKARFQQIDPNDEFFRVVSAAAEAPFSPEPPFTTGEDFGPSISSQQQSQSAGSIPGSPAVVVPAQRAAPPPPPPPAIDFSRTAMADLFLLRRDQARWRNFRG